MNILHATCKSMIMLQIGDLKNQKFDEIVYHNATYIYKEHKGARSHRRFRNWLSY
jgi:hypothetical protein